MTGWVVAIAAAALGIAHARLLRRAVRLGSGPVGMLARLVLAAALLGLAAGSGRLAAGALGWGVGFAGGALVLTARWE